MSILEGLLLITGIGAGFMILFLLALRYEGFKILSPCMLLAFLTIAIKKPADNIIPTFFAYTLGYIIVYIVINAYKDTATNYSNKTKDS